MEKLSKLHRKYKASQCSICHTVGELHIHHRNGHHYDDFPSNYITVCQNCHNLIHKGIIGLEPSPQLSLF